ncbi:hypothetical protein [Streptomyces sp. Tu 3180]|uniref:hypothetical protein n=1 Tax=Streptomyces sp. Tu 3180 TaxID=2682611 RepID=UPI00135B2501|nr:hypothetical protein [Streptomyces sp. Tu 3180]KAF3468516.1 hypothetical protein GL259_32370 [Streptomyces sp. Tu 3180]
MRVRSTILSGAAALTFTGLGGIVPAQAGESGASSITTFYEHSGHRGAGLERSGSGGTCYNLPPEWQKRVSSIFGSATVRLYTAGNCYGTSREYVGGVQYVGDDMNDRAVSFRIW